MDPLLRHASMVCANPFVISAPLCDLSHIYLKDTIFKIYPINLVDSVIYVPGMLKTFSVSNTSTEEPGPPAALLPEN